MNCRMKSHSEKTKLMKKIVFLLALLFVVGATRAQDIPERPNPPRLVNDLANVMSSEEVRQFEAELEDFARQTSNQIVVVTVPDLGGTDIADYSFKLGEKWGVGQKDKDNGIVIIFKPKTATEKGQVFVAVGYGLEGAIPDAIANRDVVDREMIPRFKEGDIYGGLRAGTDVLMKLAAGEFSAEQYHRQASGNEGGGGALIFIIIAFVAVVMSVIRGRSRRFYSGGSSLPFWIAMGMMNASRNSHRGAWDNFHHGGGSFGGFGGGGGGFGGFGGGSFGGGGAGGSW